MTGNTVFVETRDSLSKENSTCLKGIFAVFVLCHHLQQKSGLLADTAWDAVFSLMGYLSVAVFFFLSGYGLMKSYEKGGGEYIRNFPRNRIIPFYCDCLVLIGMYTVVDLILGEPVTRNTLVQSFFFGDTVIIYGWYLQTALQLYLIFTGVFSVLKKKTHQYLAVGFALILYCLRCVGYGTGEWWYISVFPFLLGIMWPEIRRKCSSWPQSVPFQIGQAFLSFLVFSALCVWGLTRSDSVWRMLWIQNLTAVCFVLLVLAMIRLVRIDNRITRFLGSISFEMYVTQGAALALLRSRVLYIENPYVYVILAAALTFAFSVAVRPLFDRIHSEIRQNG